MGKKSSFLAGNGNELEFGSPIKYISLALIAVFLLLIFLFKKQIKNSFQKQGKILWFKNGDSLLMGFGGFIILFQIFKLILYIVYDYPQYGEHLQLHMCRIHMGFIGIVLILKKKEIIKYIATPSLLGALIAIGFGGFTYPESGVRRELFMEHGFTEADYNVGPDSFFYGDYYVLHISLSIIPVLLGTGYSGKVSAVNLYRTIMLYSVVLLFMGFTNGASSALPKEGQANNGYLGPNKQNDYNDVLGVLTHWPQNLFLNLILGDLLIFIGQLVGIGQSSGRKILGKEFKEQHKGVFKKIFKLK